MSIRNIPLVEGEFFHVYNRGNSKQKIFLDNEDYERFIKLLYLCNSEYSINFRNDIVKKHINAFEFERGQNIVFIGAWVLMPNHFHIYISSGPKQGLGQKQNELTNVTKFMLKLCTSYSKYFNKKYKRTGKLFEDKFKATHISNEVQAKYLFSYIHLNPIKLIDPKWKEEGINDRQKAISFLSTYKWSSYHEFSGTDRYENKILSRENFLSYFSDIKSFQKDIFEWLVLSKA